MKKTQHVANAQLLFYGTSRPTELHVQKSCINRLPRSGGVRCFQLPYYSSLLHGTTPGKKYTGLTCKNDPITRKVSTVTTALNRPPFSLLYTQRLTLQVLAAPIRTYRGDDFTGKISAPLGAIIKSHNTPCTALKQT